MVGVEDVNGWGAKKFGMSFKAQGNQTLGGISRDFCWDILGVLEKFEKKRFVFNSRPLHYACFAPIRGFVGFKKIWPCGIFRGFLD